MSAPRPPVPSGAAGAASRATPPPPVAPCAPTSATAAAAAKAPTPSTLPSTSISASSPLASRALAGAQSMAAALKASRERVAMLEAEVAELRAELSPAPPPPAEEPSTSASTTGTITLRYSTGWQEAFVHFSRDGRAWTTVPGLKLVQAPAEVGSPNPGDRELKIEGVKRLDFVMTDGHGNWDTPVPSYALGNSGDGGGSDSDGGGGSSSSRGKSSSRHYSIEEPGTWRLKSGKLTKLD